jgi:choline-phosphate cytidylyltransferase
MSSISVLHETPSRIYVDGVFDIVHYGHMRLFEQIKQQFPKCHLIAGVCNDQDTKLYKRTTIMSNAERCETLRHIKWVDQIIPNSPWIITEEFMATHLIDLVCHDPKPTSDFDEYAVPKKLGKFYETYRTQGISTTDIIQRVTHAMPC